MPSPLTSTGASHEAIVPTAATGTLVAPSSTTTEVREDGRLSGEFLERFGDDLLNVLETWSTKAFPTAISSRTTSASANTPNSSTKSTIRKLTLSAVSDESFRESFSNSDAVSRIKNRLC